MIPQSLELSQCWCRALLLHARHWDVSSTRVFMSGRAQMNEDHNQDPFTKPPARDKRRPQWWLDLNPNQVSPPDVGQVSDARVNAEWTAFHLRKRGLDLGGVNVELEQAPNDEGDGK